MDTDQQKPKCKRGAPRPAPSGAVTTRCSRCHKEHTDPDGRLTCVSCRSHWSRTRQRRRNQNACLVCSTPMPTHSASGTRCARCRERSRKRRARDRRTKPELRVAEALREHGVVLPRVLLHRLAVRIMHGRGLRCAICGIPHGLMVARRPGRIEHWKRLSLDRIHPAGGKRVSDRHKRSDSWAWQQQRHKHELPKTSSNTRASWLLSPIRSWTDSSTDQPTCLAALSNLRLLCRLCNTKRGAGVLPDDAVWRWARWFWTRWIGEDAVQWLYKTPPSRRSATTAALTRTMKAALSCSMKAAESEPS